MKKLYKRIGAIAVATLLMLSLAIPTLAHHYDDIYNYIVHEDHDIEDANVITFSEIEDIELDEENEKVEETEEIEESEINSADRLRWTNGFGFHCCEGIVDIYFNGVRYRGNNIQHHPVGTDQHPIYLVRINNGTRWMLDTDSIVCAECGTTDWYTRSNENGVITGANIRTYGVPRDNNGNPGGPDNGCDCIIGGPCIGCCDDCDCDDCNIGGPGNGCDDDCDCDDCSIGGPGNGCDDDCDCDDCNIGGPGNGCDDDCDCDDCSIGGPGNGCDDDCDCDDCNIGGPGNGCDDDCDDYNIGGPGIGCPDDCDCEDCNDEYIPLPTLDKRIWSQARVNGTSSQYADPVPNLKIVDRVYYSGLIPGENYVTRGILMDRITGEKLIIDGSTVEGARYFTPIASEGYVDVYFFLDGTGMDGRTIVIFENLYKQVSTNSNTQAFVSFLPFNEAVNTEWIHVAEDVYLNNDNQTVWFNTLTNNDYTGTPDINTPPIEDNISDYNGATEDNTTDDDETTPTVRTRADSPQTGDEFNSIIWIVLIFASIALMSTMVAARLKTKKNHNNKE